MLISGRENWLPHYRADKSSIWVSTEMSNGEVIFFKEDEGERLSYWLDVKQMCVSDDLSIHSITLQFKSHKVITDTSDCEAVYLTKSAIGRLGAERSRDCITVGKLKNGVVYKTMWMTPELIEEISTQDKIEECIQEALIYHDKKKNRQK
jgi:hypothetical protein